MMKGFFPKRPAAGRKRDRPERPGGSAALGVFEVRFRNDGHTTENISCNIMLQLIFCSVLNGRGQGKTRSHFRRGLLFCSSSGTWMSGDGDPTAGRSSKLTTGNINWNIMFHLIFRASADRLDREIAHKILHRLLEQHRRVRHRPLGSSVVHRLWLWRRYSSCVSGSNR